MARKPLTIADQINALESDLENKSEELRIYEKSVDKLLKQLFGLDKKAIEKLINDSKKNRAESAYKISAPDDGVEEESPQRDFSSEGHGPSSI